MGQKLLSTQELQKLKNNLIVCFWIRFVVKLGRFRSCMQHALLFIVGGLSKLDPITTSNLLSPLHTCIRRCEFSASVSAVMPAPCCHDELFPPLEPQTQIRCLSHDVLFQQQKMPTTPACLCITSNLPHGIMPTNSKTDNFFFRMNSPVFQFASLSPIRLLRPFHTLSSQKIQAFTGKILMRHKVSILL